MKLESLWLVGAGPMARAHAEVLCAQQVAFETIGRGESSAGAFEAEIQRPVRIGGLAAALKTSEAPQRAIVAVGVEHLADSALALIRAGTKQILLEKPGGLHLGELHTLNAAALEHGASIQIAYNRRFFSSVLAARELIDQEGGLTSFRFEFTEWGHVIEPLEKGAGVKAHWALGNSAHVIDLAFYFGGLPVDWQHWRGGELSWHPAAARFCGAGVTASGALFSYSADWQAPGRWALELMTRQHRYILCPIEGLQRIPLGSVRAESIPLDDQLDRDFKPGLYRQDAAFLAGSLGSESCSLQCQLAIADVVSDMAGYATP